MRGNLVVGQSGGPTAVINNSLVGVIHEAMKYDEIDGIYGMLHGIVGVLDENFVDLRKESKETLEGLRDTPASALGTVRYRVTDEDYDRLIEVLQAYNIRYFFYIGGNDSMDTTHKIHLAAQKKGYELVAMGVPKTIDNDLGGTVVTFGFDTAVGIATEAIDRLHSTAKSHDRIMVVEVMGRHAGWIALNSGISGAARVILIPEIPFDIGVVCNHIMEDELLGERYAIVVAAEGAAPVGGGSVDKGAGEVGRQDVVLGGIGEWVAEQVRQRTGKDTRSLVLGHLQRGGSPTTFDRLLALRFGAAAVRMIEKEEFGCMVALAPPNVRTVPLEQIIGTIRGVPLDGDTLQTARDIGICFGDRPV